MENIYFPRYIASICKKLGYDGIAFKSKYSTVGESREDRGKNYAIFSYKKCHAINTNVYSVAKRKVHLFDDYKRETVKFTKSRIDDKNISNKLRCLYYKAASKRNTI